jgi:hypothetical protein
LPTLQGINENGFQENRSEIQRNDIKGPSRLSYERVQTTFSECDYKRRPGNYERPKRKIEIS